MKEKNTKRLEEFESIICLDGSIPKADFFVKAKRIGIPIIAADGGTNSLLYMDIVPDFVVGDMDSFKGSSRVPKDNVIFVEDQNYSDFEKAINFVKNNSFKNSLVIGINGGEIDHIINNVNIFMRYSEDFPMWFYDIPSKGNSKIGSVASSGNINLHLDKESMVSLFSFDDGKIKTEGLVWEIDSQSFPIMEKSAARNKTKEEKVNISTTGNRLLAVYSGKF